MFWLIAVACARGRPVIRIPRIPVTPNQQDNRLVQQLTNSFWTEYGAEWANFVGRIANQAFERSIMHLDALDDTPENPGARFMFFGVPSGNKVELWLLKENAQGELIMAVTSGRSVTTHRCRGVVLDGRGRLSFQYGERFRRSKTTPPGDIYRNTYEFYQNVFMSPQHGFTRSDFLTWSLKHSIGVTRDKFQQLAKLIVEPVEQALVHRNMDFLIHWAVTLRGADKPEVYDILGLLAHHQGRLLSYLRGCTFAEIVPLQETAWARADNGHDKVAYLMAQGDNKTMVDLGTLALSVIHEPKDILKFLRRQDVLNGFRGAPYWRLTTLTILRMIWARNMREKVSLCRTALISQVLLRGFWSETSTIFGFTYGTEALSAFNKMSVEIMMMGTSKLGLPFFNGDDENQPTAPLYLDETNLPTLVGVPIPRHWGFRQNNGVGEAVFDKNRVILDLLERACSETMQWRIENVYRDLIGTDNWAQFNAHDFQRWADDQHGNPMRFLAERGLALFVNTLNQRVDLRDGEGTGVGGGQQRQGGRRQPPPLPPRRNEFENELLNALKTLSRDLRHSRRHTRLHRRW